MAEPDRKRQRLDLSDSFTVVIGTTKKEFTLHTCVATKTSQYFQKATSGAWREAKDRQVIISHFDPLHFDIYSHWLYKNEIIMGVIPQDPTPVFTDLMELYLLGQYLLDTAFQNAVVDETLRIKVTRAFFPGRSAIVRIWSSTPSGCTMQRFIVRCWSTTIKADAVEKHAPDTVVDFLKQLIEDMARSRDEKIKPTSPRWNQRCEYHEHNQKTPKELGCTVEPPEADTSSRRSSTKSSRNSSHLSFLNGEFQ